MEYLKHDYIGKEAAEELHNFKYSGEDKSFTLKYFYGPSA